MPETPLHKYDILIAGAGFAGSITALILHKTGFRVCVIESGQHPRFSIGESSTPVADMIIRELAQRYDLPWLYDFSRYGSWQQSHPEIVCGIKRGFSFFKHFPGEAFSTNSSHKNELLVAASSEDMQSDTNWLRADFDSFLAQKLKDGGIAYFDQTKIISAQKSDLWQFETIRHDAPSTFKSSFLIDATGSGNLLEGLLQIKSAPDGFLTDSFAVFSHFTDVKKWVEMLDEAGIPMSDFPYDPDHSATHHVLDEGWMWVLRFNDGRTSLGFVLDCQKYPADDQSAELVWNDMVKKYPSIHQMLANASFAPIPGKIIQSPRLQRRLESCFGPGWVALPHTVGFVDPLFSSGIAHSLCGIEKITNALSKYWGDQSLLTEKLQGYELAVFEELKLTDKLVAGCYLCMPYFELFNAWSMLYFAATISYEQRRLKGEHPEYFLSADDPYIKEIVEQSYHDLLKITENGRPGAEDVARFTNQIRERIKPVNIAGLLDPSSNNMYRHTVAVL